MNKNILHTEVQDFINGNLHSNTSKLLFKGSPFKHVTIQEIVEQIEAKKKAEKKLPTWFNTPNIYYPNKLNIEQTSSEISAAYKATLVSGVSLIDLTGGFGVDTFYFSKKIDHIHYCELDAELAAIVAYNFKLFNAKNIDVHAVDGIRFLQQNNSLFDWIFLDPSRRDSSKGRVFLLQDCIPNVPENLELLFEHCDNILLKASPMLDITQGIKELKWIKEIQVVAVENEVKELLFILQKHYEGKSLLKAVHLYKNNLEIVESNVYIVREATYSKPQKYLYEPNTAILKAGLFNEVSIQYSTNKLHVNSHLYTSDNLIDFPGRCFIIRTIIPYNKKAIKTALPELKANITIRNFPETVAQIRKKTGLKDGGSYYLFFTTDIMDKHIVLVCTKA